MKVGPGRRGPRAGVTLLELMLSLALMALMAAALATVLGLSGRAAQRISAAGTTTDLLLARLAFRGWIEGAPLGADFAGGADALRFETLTDEPPFTVTDPAVVSLARDAAGMVVAGIDTPEGDGSSTRRLVLAADGEFRIRYFGRPPPSASPAWHDDWPVAAGLPDLVRIEFRGTGAALPPLTAIPALVARQSEMSLSSPAPPG